MTYDLDFTVDLTAGEELLRVIGEPLHTTASALIAQYQNKDIDEFLQLEATRSCGSYIILDQTKDRVRLITSPGFSAGYIDQTTHFLSTEIGELLDKRDAGEPLIDDVGTAFWFSFEGRSPYSSSWRTPFQNIHKLKPGLVGEFKDGKWSKMRSYLPLAANHEQSFQDALHEAVSAFRDESVTLLFSGGKDSTAIYLALREELGKESITPVTVDLHPIVDAEYERVTAVAENLNMDLTWEEYSSGWPPTDKRYLEAMEDRLRSNLVDPINPHHGVREQRSNEHIVSGQNMDAMLSLDMPKPPQTKRNLTDIKSLAELLEIGDLSVRYATTNMLTNMMYSGLYADSELYRRMHLSLAIQITKLLTIFADEGKNQSFLGKIQRAIYNDIQNLSPLLDSNSEIDKSREGILIGLLTHQLPSVISTPESISKSDVQNELEKMRKWWKKEDIQPSTESSLVRYYHYASNAAEMGSIPSPVGMTQEQICNWGPFMSLFLRPVTLKDALSPKYNVRDYIKSKTGTTFSNLAQSNNTTNVSKTEPQTSDLPLVKRHQDRLSAKSSRIIGRIDSKRVKNGLKESMENTSENLFSQGEFTDQKKTALFTAHRIINLDILVERAEQYYV
jgi:hypothetical protein